MDWPQLSRSAASPGCIRYRAPVIGNNSGIRRAPACYRAASDNPPGSAGNRWEPALVLVLVPASNNTSEPALVLVLVLVLEPANNNMSALVPVSEPARNNLGSKPAGNNT